MKSQRLGEATLICREDSKRCKDSDGTLLLIVGPGLGAWHKADAETWAENLDADYVYGCGDTDLTEADIRQAACWVGVMGKPMTIFVVAHGNSGTFPERDGETSSFLMQIQKGSGPESRLTSRQFFESVSYYHREKPIDIILDSCHSGAAFFDADVLPQGSRVLAVTPPGKSIYTKRGVYVRHALSCGRPHPTIDDVFDAFLSHSLVKEDFWPAMAKVGEGIEIPQLHYYKLFSGNLTEEEREKLVAHRAQKIDEQGARLAVSEVCRPHRKVTELTRVRAYGLVRGLSKGNYHSLQDYRRACCP